MTNRLLDDYLNDVRRHLRGVKESERDDILAELAAHLENDIERRARENPQLSYDEVTLAATHAFGEPAEIGRQYAAAVAPRRRWIPIFVAGIVGLFLGLAIGAALNETDASPPRDERIVDHYSKLREGLVNATGVTGDTFSLREPVDTLRLKAEVASTGGCGNVRFYQDGALLVGDSTTCNDDYDLEFDVTGGSVFRVEYDLIDFSGHILVQVYSELSR